MTARPQISYKLLRKINPEAARTAVIEYLASNKGNIAEAARVFGIQRLTVYNIIKKNQEADLNDRPKAPGRVVNKTSVEVVNRIFFAQKMTGYGARRLRKHLIQKYGMTIAYGTLRGILRRKVGSLRT